MKNQYILTLLISFFGVSVYAQCPTFRLEITTQQQIDNFSLTYPSCSEVEKPIDIEGSGITNLSGLAGITSIIHLTISNTPNLVSLEGLSSLQQASLMIINNTGIENMQGLNALQEIESVMGISNNNQLVDLSGLEALTSGSVVIWNNPSLVSLNGLNSLSETTSLGVHDNPLITSLSALENLTSATDIYIANNENLNDLTGLQNLTSLWYDAVIKNNPSLVSLDLNSLQSVRNLEISDNDQLTSLDGLESLTTVEKDFILRGNSSLTNTQSLNALQSVGRNLIVAENNSLANFSGFSALTSINDTFQISNHDQMIDLTGLENLTYVGKELIIKQNSILKSLNGIENITGLDHLEVAFNYSLSECAVKSVCDHLISGGSQSIGGNSNGCLNATEVLEQCTVSTDYLQSNSIKIYPNPTAGLISLPAVDADVKLKITDSQGRHIDDFIILDNSINISHCAAGLYFLSMHKQDKVVTLLVIKQ